MGGMEVISICDIEFKNVTVTFNNNKVNKKLCKKKNRYMTLWCFMTVLLMFVALTLGFLMTQNVSFFLLTIVESVLILGAIFGFTFLGYWLIYHKTIKAFFFVEWLFKVREVYAGWYNDKILIRVQHSNGIIDDYSLQGFVRSIKNEFVITDKSEKGKPIHIYIDVTNDDKTIILIENTVCD